MFYLPLQKQTAMKAIIAKYQERLNEYRTLVTELENRGIENLSFEETEDYGLYKGKMEILEEIIPELEKQS